jgi:predicted HTH domain antitoxin
MSTSFEELVQASGLTEPELRREFAVWLYERKRLTLAQASHLAGAPFFDFRRDLVRRGIPVHSEERHEQDERDVREGVDDDLEHVRLAIQHAIEVADAKTARALIAEGRARFPDDEWIARAERVMAIPTAHIVPAKPDRDPRADLAWLDAHADEYRGQWVALANGDLVGTAPSIELLAAAVPELKSYFVTRVAG